MPRFQLNKKGASEPCLWVFRAGVGLILLSALLFLLGFATDYWQRDDDTHFGLWETCQRGKCQYHEQGTLPDYHVATQAMQTAAAIVYSLAPLLHWLLYWVKVEPSTDCRTRVFDISYSIGSVFHLTSLAVFGALHPVPELLSWSYNMSGGGLGLAVLGLAFIIGSRRRALRDFHFPSRSNSRTSQRSSRVGPSSNSSGSSRVGTPQSGDRVFPGSSSPWFGPQRPPRLPHLGPVRASLPPPGAHRPSLISSPQKPYPKSLSWIGSSTSPNISNNDATDKPQLPTTSALEPMKSYNSEDHQVPTVGLQVLPSLKNPNDHHLPTISAQVSPSKDLNSMRVDRSPLETLTLDSPA